jgi:hypothetical protein
LLIACIASRIATTSAITLPSGWTLVAQRGNNNVLTTTSASASGLMAFIIRGASAPALTFTHPIAPSIAIGRIVAYRGTQTIALNAGTAGTTAINTTAVSLAGFTTSVANTLLVAAVLGGQEAAWSSFAAVTDPTTASGATDTSTAPSSTWRERADTNSVTGAQTSLAIFDAVKATAGATGNFTTTASLGAAQSLIAAAFLDLVPTSDAWNVADKSLLVTLSNSDKTATGAGSGGVRSTTTRANGSAGKYYAEFVFAGTGLVTAVGIMPTSGTLTVNTAAFAVDNAGQIIVNAGLAGIDLGTPAVGDVVSVAWDAGAERVWFRLNAGDWNLSATANPATGAEGVDVSFAASTPHALWMRAATTGPAVAIRTSAADFTQAVPSTGFTSWMGEALVGGPTDVNVTTGSQTTLAVTQSATAAVELAVTGAQTTAEATTAGTIQATEAPRVVTGAQTISATTQTSAIAAGLAITGAQTLTPVTPTSGVKVGLAVTTGAQTTSAATTVVDADAIATGTAAQTLAATTQSSGLTLGPASFAVTGAQTLSPVSQVLTASISDPIISVSGAQATLAATQTATAALLAKVTTGSQNTNAVTQSLTGDVDAAVTASQTLSPAATSATANLLAAVTGSQTLAAAATSAAATALASVTGSQTLSGAATTGAIVLTPFGTAVVNGAQTLSEVTQTSAIVLGPLPALNVTGAQTLAACTTTGTISGEVIVEPPIELPSGGGGSRAYRRRLREAREGRRVFEEERQRRIAAIGREDERRDPLTMEPAPPKPAPETIAMLNRLLYEPITREIEQPQPVYDDGGEEELLLLLLAD